MAVNALVLGGSGFVGPHIVSRLLSLNCRVTLLNRGTRPIPGTVQVTADRTDEAQLRRVAEALGTFDALVDTSAYRASETSLAWSALRGRVGKWIHLSSASVYRAGGGALPAESFPTGGADIWGDYGREKSAADDDLISRHDPDVTIMRPPYIYGPGNNNDRETFVWARVLRGLPLVVPGDGQTAIQFLHVADLASLVAMVALGDLDALGVVNVAHAGTVTLAGWVEVCAAAAGVEPRIVLEGGRAPHIQARSYFPFRNCMCAVDTRRIEALGWRPAFDLAAGLPQTLATYDPAQLQRAVRQTPAEVELLRLWGVT